MYKFKDKKYFDIIDTPEKAYKDIDQVIENQNDLVDVVVKLKPLGVIKG